MVKLTLTVSDIATTYAAGFRYIVIERAALEDGTYSYLGYIFLNASTSVYYYTDVGGAENNWYKSKYTDTATSPYGLESSYSTPVRGDVAEIYHNITYPLEVTMTTADMQKVRRLRTFIGDQKELVRDYVDDCYSSVQDDGHTYELSQKGWPLYICLDNVDKTRSTDPYTNGWRYLTFSGTISTVTGTLDIYYNTFRWADSEILQQYDDALIPPGLTSSTVTTDHMLLQTAIDLLEAENWRDYIENGARIVDSDTTWDPSPGYKARESAIKRLQKRLDDLVNQYRLVYPGWRVD
jgi:hypothetical protein